MYYGHPAFYGIPKNPNHGYMMGISYCTRYFQGYFHTPTLAPTNQWGPHALAPMAVFGALQAPRSHGTPGRIAVIAVASAAS